MTYQHTSVPAPLSDPYEDTSRQPGSGFPSARPRRLRLGKVLRSMVRETELNSRDFIYPIFVRSSGDPEQEILSMPGIYQWPVDRLSSHIKAVLAADVPAVMLFGIPSHKDPAGSENYSPDGVVQQAIRVIKEVSPELVVATDVCMCEYTDHGHCGVLNMGPGYDHRLPEGYVLNDPTLDVLQKVALSHAEAGADIVAPSGMMDGMVGAVRGALDGAGYEHISILSYSVKYASAFYGPFRDAAESPPSFGDRKSHQMDPANAREALREAALDVSEGADMLMVKPALPYLDVIRRVRDAFPQMPMAAYNVSGEYSMVKAASINGWVDERQVVLEALTGIKRAGADLILTYHALQAARWLANLD
jgi:porphobilinogen synthase